MVGGRFSQKALYLEVGKRIRAARGETISQQDLAKKLSLGRTSITNIEKGRQRILLHTLYEIAEALDVPVSDLVPALSELATAPVEVGGGEELSNRDKNWLERMKKAAKEQKED